MQSDEAQEQSEHLKSNESQQLALGMWSVLQGLGEWLSAMPGKGPEVL